MNNREAMQEEFEAWWNGRQLPENMKAAFFMVWQAALASQAQQPTELSKQLREYAADSGYSHNDYADTMLAAASEIERLTTSQAQQTDSKPVMPVGFLDHGGIFYSYREKIKDGTELYVKPPALEGVDK